MKFNQYGYTEKEIKVRKMSMGAIVMTAGEALAKRDRMDMEIRLIDTFTGTVERWDGIKGILLSDYSPYGEVNVYEMRVMTETKTGKDYLKIVVSDDVDYEDEYNII